MQELTLDTGALIAMERRKASGLFLMKASLERAKRLLVPVPVISEWWRGRSDVRDDILGAVLVRPLPVGVARAAGEALAQRAVARHRVSVMDAIVVAFAAAHGGIVYTSDVDDLGLLRDACFPSVRVLGV